MKISTTINSEETRKFIDTISEICDIIEQPDDRRGLEETTHEKWNKPAENFHFCGGVASYAIGDDGMNVSIDVDSEFAIKVMTFSTKIAKKIYPAYTAVKGIFDMIVNVAGDLGESWKALIEPHKLKTEKVSISLYNNPGLGVVMMVVTKVNQFGEVEPMSWYHLTNTSGLPDRELHHLTENGHGEAYMVRVAELTDPELIGDRKKLQQELDRINSSIRSDLKYTDANVKAYDEEPTGSAVRYHGFDLMGMSSDELVDLRTAAVRRIRELNEFPEYDWKFSDRTRFEDLNPADLEELIDRIDTELTFRK